jgi:hypothetical protein
MARTAEMPKAIQSDIPMDAVGEALLQHYNVGIQNPWFEIGRSDQETYNRRKLPWAGKSYTVSEDGSVSGPNTSEIPEGLLDSWQRLADAARSEMEGERYENLEAMFQQGLQAVGEAVQDATDNNAYQSVEVTTADGETKEEERYVRPGER